MIDWIRAQMRRRHARRHLKRPAVTTPFGFAFLGPKVMQAGDFEPSETRLLRGLLAKADLFVNVGANFGYYVCMARQMGVRTVAVEPVPINLETLRRNIALNGWETGVDVHPVACGEAVGSADIFGEGTGASFVSGWARNPNALRHTVPVRPLDDILEQETITAQTLFLVDVEGFELEVLHGAAKTLANPAKPVWMLESGLTDHRPGGEMNLAFLKVMEIAAENGYRVLSAVDPRVEISIETVRHSIEGGTDRIKVHNFLFVPGDFESTLVDD